MPDRAGGLLESKSLNGSRDQALGDDDALYYADAAEVLFLMERLGQ